jgi:hypothetical protein
MRAVSSSEPLTGTSLAFCGPIFLEEVPILVHSAVTHRFLCFVCGTQTKIDPHLFVVRKVSHKMLSTVSYSFRDSVGIIHYAFKIRHC